MVRQVSEVYVDFFPLSPDVFTLDIASCMSLETAHGDCALLDRICSGLTAVLLALKVSLSFTHHRLVTLCMGAVRWWRLDGAGGAKQETTAAKDKDCSKR